MSEAKSALLIVLKGVLMGAADVVPGVSGGTIAFITGIYERLINALKSLTPMALLMLCKQGPRVFWQHIDGTFLVLLFAGVLGSIFFLAHLISHLLLNYPLQLWGFFFGLILASIWYVVRELRPFGTGVLLTFALGIGIALLVAVAKPVQTPVNHFTVFLSGMIAICAMILPGISGSFLLLIMGMYPVYLRAITELDLMVLGVFIAGCITGLLLFSHVLSFLLSHYKRLTLGLLSGFLAGSLVIVWPWKEVVSTMVDRHGQVIPLVQKNIAPWHYQSLVGNEPEVAWVVLLALIGLLVVILVEYGASQLHWQESE
ncbi:MAG TPA: DUF368 domain-containing protein [Cellvibrionaceae bacterium]